MYTVGDQLVTMGTLEQDLRALGLEAGMTLIVHSSFKKLGTYVCGGPQAFIMAIEQVLGPEGTLVMPTQSGDLSDPADWQRPPVPMEWWETIRREMPAYDPDLTVTSGMGIIPETFRKQQSVVRSEHPMWSFAAWGKYAQYIVSEHRPEEGLGDFSPLGKLYELDAFILLVGVGHNSNTSLHLAEYRASFPGKAKMKYGSPVISDGARIWLQYEDLELSSDDFEAIAVCYEQEQQLETMHHGLVALAPSVLIKQRPLVNYAVEWMERNRGIRQE
jgi:aminoglycoside 3-N-acetyltransferase